MVNFSTVSYRERCFSRYDLHEVNFILNLHKVSLMELVLKCSEKRIIEGSFTAIAEILREVVK